MSDRLTRKESHCRVAANPSLMWRPYPRADSDSDFSRCYPSQLHGYVTLKRLIRTFARASMWPQEEQAEGDGWRWGRKSTAGPGSLGAYSYSDLRETLLPGHSDRMESAAVPASSVIAHPWDGSSSARQGNLPNGIARCSGRAIPEDFLGGVPTAVGVPGPACPDRGRRGCGNGC